VNQRTQAYYAALAPHYDGLPHHRPEPVRAVARAIVQALRLGEGDLLADLCCGTGLFCSEILRQRPLEYQIVAVDESPAMLERVRARCDPSVRAVAMDATAFSAFPVRYDKILVKDAMEELEDPEDLFRRIRERLGRRGRVLVVETAPDSQTALFKEARRRWEAVARRPEEIASLLEQARFRVSMASLRVCQRLALDEVLGMVGRRYAPVLATFDDAELCAGLDEIRERHAACHSIELVHRFDLVMGVRA
jgi:ubiquinone/menaquinone biosynthesis C-methylase UbiE